MPNDPIKREHTHTHTHAHEEVWDSPARREIRSRLTPQQLELEEWLYEVTRDHRLGVLLLGHMTATASRHQDWTFWDALAHAQDTIRLTFH